MPMEPMPLDLNSEWVSAEHKMKLFVDQHPFADTKFNTVLEQGELCDVISKLILKNDIDLLVLGTHGRQGLRKVVMGSAAEEIFRRASCPVLTVGPHAAHVPHEFETWKRILFATDFSPGSLRALPYALSLAEENQASLVLLHLVPLVPMHEEEQVEAAIRERMRKLVPAEAATWCIPEYAVRFDFPAEGILSVAREREADVIVMGVRKSDHPRTLAHLPWATAHEVVCRAHCPVLTVRG
jgi:nucleotide-binding universal stress UspA family protein